jgi:RNA recognition motif-containing protein
VKPGYFKDDIDIFTVTKTPEDLFRSLGMSFVVQSSSSSDADSLSDGDDGDGDGEVDENEKIGDAAVSPPHPSGTKADRNPAHPLSSPQKTSALESTVMVQNLSAKADRLDLISMFQCCGTVNKIYFYINHQGERSGSALVEFSSPLGSAAALNSSGVVCMGELVRISRSNVTILAMEQLDHDVRLQNIDPNNCLVAYVSNLPPSTKQHEIMDVFRPCGSIVSVKIIRPTLPSAAPPFAKVTFSSSLSCKAALELDGVQLKGLPLSVFYAPPAHCSVSPPPITILAGDHDDDDKCPLGFQWLEGLPGTPLCPRSKEQKDCTVEFTHYFLEPADDVARQGRFVSCAKVNGRIYTKNVHFRGFRWEGREVRIGDVVMLEANDAEWIARVDTCWEERTDLSKPQNNRRLVSLTWYYHKKDLLSDLSDCRKKLDLLSKHNLNQMWDDGNELLFSDHKEDEQDIGSITGTMVTIVGSEAEYSALLRHSGRQKSRVFLHRYTYENRCRVVSRFNAMTPRALDMVAAVEARAAVSESGNNAESPMITKKKRGLKDVELEMEQGARKLKTSSKTAGLSAQKTGQRQVVVSSGDDDIGDDRPLKKKAAPSLLLTQPISIKPYRFQSWNAVKNQLLAYISKLDSWTSAPRNRQPPMQLDAEIGCLMSAIDERMPSYKDLQQTQVHATLRQFYKKHPDNNNSNLARSIWTRWKQEFENRRRVNSSSARTTPIPVGPAATASDHHSAYAASGASSTHNLVPSGVMREKVDALRTGMKSRLLMVFKEQIAQMAAKDKASLKPNRCSIVGEEIERSVHDEYRGAGDQYKRHIESLLSCISSKCEFALHLLQGCIDTSAVTSADAFKDGFMEAQRTGTFVSKRLLPIPNSLPKLPLLSSAAAVGESGAAEMSSAGGQGRSQIMTALAEEGCSHAGISGNEPDEGGWGGWSLKDENFDYGV